MPLVPDNDDDFDAVRTDLLDAFQKWLDARHGSVDTAETVADAETFLQWRFHYSTGILDTYDDTDLAEFLLGWCPRKLSVPPEEADVICRAVAMFIEFLADTRRLTGGFDRAARLMAYAEELTPQMRTAMADPANFGMAKSLFADLDVDGALTQEELQAVAQARMKEFNALPFDQRKALTDRFFEAKPEPIVLPFVYLPPTAAELEAAAMAAPLLRKIDALRDYLGPARH